MAHSDPDSSRRSAAVPPRCPRCRSQSTEVVGRSGDGASVTVRCNSCGERSSVAPSEQMDDDLRDLFAGNPAADTHDEEAAARVAIGGVLSELRDAAARARVLRWAIEQFGAGADAASNIDAAPKTERITPKGAKDPTLAVDDLIDFFEPGGVGDFPGPDKQ